MVTIALKKFNGIAGLEHNKTKWFVGKDLEDGRVKELIHTEIKTTDINSLTLDITIPVGDIYYAQAQLYFKDVEVEYFTKPITIKNINANLDNMLLREETYIEEPLILTDYNIISHTGQEITINTSNFKSNNDQHKATHWIITDGNNNILYCNLYDRQNLTSINIPNDYIYRSKNKLIVMASHVGGSGIESPFSSKTYTIKSTYNFEIETNINYVKPLEDLIIKFRKILRDSDYNIIKVELIDYNTDSIILSTTLSDNGTIEIPWYLLKENMQFMLDIYCYDNNNIYRKVVKNIKVASFNNIVIRDTSYKYTNALEFRDSAILKVPNNLHIESMLDGTVLMPVDNSKEFNIYRFNNNILSNTRETPVGINLLNDKHLYTLVKLISRNMLLIDTYNDSFNPTFMLYKYNPNYNTFSLVHTTERTDEKIPMGATNSILAISSTELIYMPYGQPILKTYNIEDGSVSNIKDLPINNYTKGVLIRGGNNQVIIANSKDYNICAYNYTTKKFVTGLQFGPKSFIDNNLKVVYLINGDTLILRVRKDSIEHPIDRENRIRQEQLKRAEEIVNKLKQDSNTAEDTTTEETAPITDSNVNIEDIPEVDEEGRTVIDEAPEHGTNTGGDIVIDGDTGEVDISSLDIVANHDVSLQRFSYATRQYQRFQVKYTKDYPNTTILNIDGSVHMYNTIENNQGVYTMVHTYK